MNKDYSYNFQITKALEKEDGHFIHVLAADETVDRAKESMDYINSKPYFQKWSESVAKATNGMSFGNVRVQHNSLIPPAGKVSEPLIFNDESKKIEAVIKITNDEIWEDILDGVYSGVSIRGRQIGTKRLDSVKGSFVYTVDPYEISVCDLPCNPSSTLRIIKADGIVIDKSFSNKIKEKDNTMEHNEVIKTALADEIQKVSEDIKKVFQGSDQEKRQRLVGALNNFVKVPVKFVNSDINMYIWIKDVFPDKVVFESDFDGDKDIDLYECSYVISDDGIVAITSDPIEVSVDYKPAQDELSDADHNQEPTVSKTEDDEVTKTVNTVPVNIEIIGKEKIDEYIYGDFKTKLDEIISKAIEDKLPKEIEIKEEEKTVEDIIKTIGEDIIKVGAKHSKEHIEKLQNIHHAVAEIGGICKCSKCSGMYNSEEYVTKTEGNEIDNAAVSTDISETTDKVNEEVIKTDDVIPKTNAVSETTAETTEPEVVKTVSENTETVNEASQENETNGEEVIKADSNGKNEELNARIEALEKTVADLSTRNSELVTKVTFLESQPDDTNSPSAFEKQDITKTETTSLSVAQQKEKQLADAYLLVRQNPVVRQNRCL